MKKLTAKEVMQALLEGKKLTSTSFQPGEFIFLYSDGEIRNQHLNLDSLELHFNYYIYEEPGKKSTKTFWRRKWIMGNVEGWIQTNCTWYPTKEQWDEEYRIFKKKSDEWESLEMEVGE